MGNIRDTVAAALVAVFALFVAVAVLALQIGMVIWVTGLVLTVRGTRKVFRPITGEDRGRGWMMVAVGLALVLVPPHLPIYHMLLPH